MPIYEYECLTCGTIFEKRKNFSDDPQTDCPNGHGDTRRLLSAPAIVFKGSGFYINDSKGSKDSLNGTGKSSTSESKSETKSETKQETKTETKAEATASAKD